MLNIDYYFIINYFDLFSGFVNVLGRPSIAKAVQNFRPFLTVLDSSPFTF